MGDDTRDDAKTAKGNEGEGNGAAGDGDDRAGRREAHDDGKQGDPKAKPAVQGRPGVVRTGGDGHGSTPPQGSTPRQGPVPRTQGSHPSGTNTSGPHAAGSQGTTGRASPIRARGTGTGGAARDDKAAPNPGAAAAPGAGGPRAKLNNTGPRPAPGPRGAGTGASSQGRGGSAPSGQAPQIVLNVARRGPAAPGSAGTEAELPAPRPSPESYVALDIFGPLRSEGAKGFVCDGWPHLLHGIVAILQECAYAPTESSAGEFLAKVITDAKEADAKRAGEPGGPPDNAPAVRHGLLAILHDERVVAFLQARQTFEDAEIDYVAVHPSHRNQGLGLRLLKAFEAAALELGAGRLLLEVGERNIPARQLYRSFGFEPMSRRENYYHGREAALVLEKPL